MSMQDRSAEVARNMIAKYGIERAHEYAYGYAIGVYFEQTEHGKAQWMAVVAHIRTVRRTSRASSAAEI